MTRSMPLMLALAALAGGVCGRLAALEIMPTPIPPPGDWVTPPASSVTVSTHDGNLPGNTVDASLATRWSGYGTGAWIEYDLGKTFKIDRFTVAVYRGAERKNVFQMRLSTDRVNWTTVHDGPTRDFTLSPQPYGIAPQDARYVRYVGRGYVSATGGTGLWNSVTEVTIASSQRAAVAPPTNLLAQSIHDAGMIHLGWTAGGIATHQVWRGTTPTGPYTWIRDVNGTEFTDQGLQNGVRYCYVVSSGWNSWYHYSHYSNESCDTATVMPTPPPTPAPPTNLTVRHGVRMCDGSVTPLRLSWTPGQGSTSFNIYRAGTSGGAYAKVANVTTTFYESSEMVSAYWVVTGVNVRGESAYSNEVFGSWAVPTCPPPGEITPPASAVTASTNDGNLPGNTVDNSLATRWSGYGSGAWIQYDLGRIRVVQYLRLAVYRGDERRNRLEIQVSNDPASGWTTIHTAETTGTTTGPEWVDVPDRSARYVRYVGRGNVDNASGTVGGWNSVTEVDIFGW